MKRRILIVTAIAIVTMLSACSSMRSKDKPSIAGAQALNPNLVDFSSPSNLFATWRYGKKDYIGVVLVDSVQKCRAFVNTLDLKEGDANFVGDAFSTLFSALATVAKPINTVHGFSAAATIASGTKNAYLSGYFANATIANFGMVMQTYYFSAINQYLNDLHNVTNDNGIIVPIEVTKIETIHSLCTMASAQYIINQTLGSAAAKQSSPSSITVSLDFGGKDTVKVGDTATMHVFLGNGSGKTATLTADMPVSVAATNYSVTTADIAGTCDTSAVKVAADGKSFTYNTKATIPSGGCSIDLKVKPSKADTVTGEIKAGALQTDQGSNSAGTGAQTVNFTPTGAAPPAPGPGPGAAAIPPPPAAATATTHSCVLGPLDRQQKCPD